MSEPYDVAILGGGAAGLFCAALAGARGKRVVLIEHQDQVGKKIAISGGGRCNFTNLHPSPANYLSGNPHFCKSALARYTPQDFLALVERHGIPYHEKKLGQQFCTTSARAITGMLLAECAASGNVEIRCGERITAVEKPERFRLHGEKGAIEADALVIATGGLSFPKLGATDFGHRLACQFGLALTPMRPGLVPLTWSTEAELRTFGPLSGVALPVVAHCGRAEFAEAMLFTHRGLSGPAILQISSYWREGETIQLDLLAPPLSAEAIAAIETPLRQRRVKSLAAHLGAHWPTRLAETWSAHWNEIVNPQPTPGIPPKPPFQYKDREIAALLAHLRRWPLRFTGTEGYPKAEVTLGGVDTRELSSKTMEAKKVPGLYFIGEVVDVTGWLGGYNFQWAWASAAAAAESI